MAIRYVARKDTMTTAIHDIIAEIQRACEKPPAERAIALRVIEETQGARLRALESAAQAGVLRQLDSLILDTASAPGMPSAFVNRSHQDVLVELKKRVLNELKLSSTDASSMTMAELQSRLRAKVSQPLKKSA